jgi:hypothetical protein
MRNRCTVTWDAVKVLLGLLNTLLDGDRNFVGLAVTDANNFALITNYYECGEAEPTAALNYLGDAVNLDHALCEIKTCWGNCSC